MKHSTLSSSPNSGNTFVSGILQRTIKFRAWGRYGEWEEDENLDCRKWQMIDGDSLCFEDFKPICDSLESKEDVVYFMQYINCKDINGTEIYEGDIVKWGHRKGGEENPIRIAVVVLSPDIQFHIVNYKMDFLGQNKVFHYGSFIYTETEKWLEVIGNVFENPELLG
jgi:uncharacterized phage protein (TIGR01671 family)